MIKHALLTTIIFALVAGGPAYAQAPATHAVTYSPARLSAADKKILGAALEKNHASYDAQEKMLVRKLDGYNYHTDAVAGNFHEVRSSFNYAVGLLDLDDDRYRQRAFDIIAKTLSLQDTVSSSRTAGVWPYYMEEPLATKKSPADFNWADFNSVALLDIYMGHEAKLPRSLKNDIRTALVYAAKSIRKRDIQPSYTNIAIMGTYVTFVTAHLFDLPDIQAYARARFEKFYDYTLKRGFTEYNSPTYTIVALDELERMRRHISDPLMKPKIDSLYTLAWEVVAKHYHKPSGQWAGPHSRSYSSLLAPTVNGILAQASGNRIHPAESAMRADVKINHKIPEQLMHYFLAPAYPRSWKETLAIDEPPVIGTTYLTDAFALSSANRSSLWNQRRPLLAYWGTAQNPAYLQVRFLHDDYDFSSASFYSQQENGKVLAGINFITNGGDKHISIDRIKEGRITAKDLRLRFQFGNVPAGQLQLPFAANDQFTSQLPGLSVSIQLFHSVFGDYAGRWEKGGNDQLAWIDFVIYQGEERTIDLSAIETAVLGFTFSLDTGKTIKAESPQQQLENGNLSATWSGLRLQLPVKPALQPRNL